MAVRPPTRMIRLVLIEDHAMVRAGFRLLLQAQADLEIVAESPLGQEAVALVVQHQPDVVMLNICLPSMDAPEAIRQIRASRPDAAVLVVTVLEGEADLRQALDAGAAGYLPMRQAPADLVTAIRAIHTQGTYIHPELVGALVASYRARAVQPRSTPVRSRLTRRQIEVLRLVAEGLTSHQVGERLGLSNRTVDRHIENMTRRLGVRSRAELVAYGLREGLVAPS